MVGRSIVLDAIHALPAGYKKGRPLARDTTLSETLVLWLSAGTGIAAATRTTRVRLQFDVRRNAETDLFKVNFNGGGLFHKFLIDNILKTIDIEDIIRLFRLIQSHGKGGAASTTRV
jgi:hypothetical protein